MFTVTEAFAKLKLNLEFAKAEKRRMKKLISKMQMDIKKQEIDIMIRVANQNSVFLATLDVWHPLYREYKNRVERQEKQIDEAIAAYNVRMADEKARLEMPASELDFRERRRQFDERARAYRMQQEQAAATAAALEREAGVQRAILRHELLARYKTNGLAYFLTAREAENPMQKLEAANLALLSFEQFKATAVTRSLPEETAEAQRLAAAAQTELDKPFYVKWFDYACELLVTG